MQNPKDRNLDIPAEAAREKHINFLEAEEGTTSDDNRSDANAEDKERRKQWEQGLEEGRKAAEQNNE